MPSRRRAAYRPGNVSELTALRIVDPKAWEARIRAAMKAADGRTTEAAEALGISVRQLYRVLDEPLFRDVVRARRGRPSEQ